MVEFGGPDEEPLGVEGLYSTRLVVELGGLVEAPLDVETTTLVVVYTINVLVDFEELPEDVELDSALLEDVLLLQADEDVEFEPDDSCRRHNCPRHSHSPTARPKTARWPKCIVKYPVQRSECAAVKIQSYCMLYSPVLSLSESDSRPPEC